MVNESASSPSAEFGTPVVNVFYAAGVQGSIVCRDGVWLHNRGTSGRFYSNSSASPFPTCCPATGGVETCLVDACADKATAWETWHGHLAHGASRAGRPCDVRPHARVAFRPLRQPKICSIVRAMGNSTPFHKYRYETHHTARAWIARSGRHRRVPGFSRHLPLATVFRRWCPSRGSCCPQPA